MLRSVPVASLAMRRSLLNLLLLAATCSVAVGFPGGPSSPVPAINPKEAVPVQPGEVTTSSPSNNNTTITPSHETTTPSLPTSSSTSVPPTTPTTPITTTKKPTTTEKPTEPTTPTTTAKPTSTTASPSPPSPTPTPSPSPSPKPTVAPGPTTTNVPPTPVPSKGRHFDGLSFMGGIILTACLVGLSVGSYKFYKIKTERSYRTL